MAKTVRCNKCGKVIDRYVEEYSMTNVMKYGSKYDGELVELDLCPECMDELIESCKISPVVEYDKPRTLEDF